MDSEVKNNDITKGMVKDLEDKNKFILDACCGRRCFWINKKHPNTIYIDKRIREKGFDDNRPNWDIKPDIQMDFKKLNFPDKSFKLVIMDPPHLKGKEDGCRMTKRYGALDKDTWRDDIKKGFDECWRVLEDYGTLIFKWNEASIKKKEILEVIGREPLFGHPNGSKIATHWLCFMKIPKDALIQPIMLNNNKKEKNNGKK